MAARSGSHPPPVHQAGPNDHPAMTHRAAPIDRPAPAHPAALKSHRGVAGPDRGPGQAPASHRSKNRGRHKSHAGRRAPHGVPPPADAARGPARVRDLHRVRPYPARGHAVRAGGPPGNSAGPRWGPFPILDRRPPHPAWRARRNRTLRPARRAGHNRTLHLGRRGVRSRGSRCPVHRHVRTRPVPPPGHSQVTTPPPACGDHSQPRTHPEAQPVRGRAPHLPRACPGCRAGPGSPGRPANPRGLPACAGPALSRGTASRGTASVGTHAGAGHRGIRVRDRRSPAPAARAAVPAGPGRSSVPLPCQ